MANNTQKTSPGDGCNLTHLNQSEPHPEYHLVRSKTYPADYYVATTGPCGEHCPSRTDSVMGADTRDDAVGHVLTPNGECCHAFPVVSGGDELSRDFAFHCAVEAEPSQQLFDDAAKTIADEVRQAVDDLGTGRTVFRPADRFGEREEMLVIDRLAKHRAGQRWHLLIWGHKSLQDSTASVALAGLSTSMFWDPIPCNTNSQRWSVAGKSLYEIVRIGDETLGAIPVQRIDGDGIASQRVRFTATDGVTTAKSDKSAAHAIKNGKRAAARAVKVAK